MPEPAVEPGAAAHPTRCGFIAILGAPNVGKSTLLNRLVGTKVSIVSPKVQTTRRRILGITVRGPTQLVFVDTPGIFTPSPGRRLERAMVQTAWRSVEDTDRQVLVVDARRGVDRDTEMILAELQKSGRRLTLAINKLDLVKPPAVLPLIERLNQTGLFDRVFIVSALTGDGCEDLLTALGADLPEGPWLFPEDQLSDLSQRAMAAEITREKLFEQLHQELPYSLTVETENWAAAADRSEIRIDQTIYVQRASQKAIVLGKGGRQIKPVGQAARAELEQMLGCRVHLFLFVKVRPKWLEDPERYSEMGLEFSG
ncbi:MAG TPA: GTPase Era [Geminicoccaceae bacterium]|jgi:GTP-binding protein Era|nr:GTPase Era [Geminicoccaceae bacterium]